MSHKTHAKGIAAQMARRRAAAKVIVGTCRCGIFITQKMLDDHKAIRLGKKSVICNSCEGGS